jgi:hypothetical protein
VVLDVRQKGDERVGGVLVRLSDLNQRQECLGGELNAALLALLQELRRAVVLAVLHERHEHGLVRELGRVGVVVAGDVLQDLNRFVHPAVLHQRGQQRVVCVQVQRHALVERLVVQLQQSNPRARSERVGHTHNARFIRHLHGAVELVVAQARVDHVDGCQARVVVRREPRDPARRPYMETEVRIRCTTREGRMMCTHL